MSIDDILNNNKTIKVEKIIENNKIFHSLQKKF
jgi:hypothetical protein